jgi:hypothetical protein
MRSSVFKRARVAWSGSGYCAKPVRVAGVRVDRAQLMGKDYAFDGQPRWDCNLKIVASAFCTPSVSRDRAHHCKTQRTLKRVDGHDQHRSATSPLVSRRSVDVNLDEVSFGEHRSENFLALRSSQIDKAFLHLAQ